MQLAILAEAGHHLPAGAAVLDLGCGNGDLVAAYREHGYEAYGCDFEFKPGPEAERLAAAGHIRRVEQHPYRMPFEDHSFDLVISNEVFEHVRNYEETLAEHRRVLKPGGIGLHFIPSRGAPIEGHVFVPLATVIQTYGWLRLWAALGVRAPHQKGLSAAETARRNERYLKHHTNYLTKRELCQAFYCQFESVTFLEQAFLKYSRRARVLYNVSRFVPAVPALYGHFRSRILLCKAPSPRATRDAAPA